MHAEIELIKSKIEQSYFRQLSYLANKPDAFLDDLRHECEALRSSDQDMDRIAAGINQAACEVIQEQRRNPKSL